MNVAGITTICLLCLAGSGVSIPEPGEWRVIGRPAPGRLIKLTFAIKQHNTEWLEEKLNAVSYPDSPQYTNYMNFDEIAEYVYGEPESVKAVTETLAVIGAEKIDITLGRDFIIAYAPFETIEKEFKAYFLEYEHNKIPELTVVSSSYYTIPANLEQHIDFVYGLEKLSSYPSSTIKRKPSQERQSQSAGVDPNTIAEQYNTSKYTSSNPNTSQAIPAFVGQYFSPTDLKDFQQRYNLPIKPIVKIVGKNNASKPGFEASLDVQYIVATGRNVATWFVSVPQTDTYLNWIIAQENTTDSPWVHSLSYGDIERSVNVEFARRVNNEFMKFGISGRTILFAAGDSGTDCDSNGVFVPEWPTSSPYVTSVGGTTSLDTVWTAGGGGFSNIYLTPLYQMDIVQAYINGGMVPSDRLFNISGRAYPDVSAFATDFSFYASGKLVKDSGTSASTPTFAGLVSSLNDIRLNKGLKTLGFLNPLLYTKLKGHGFFDVTEGENKGLNNCKGFKAIKGWDPASGWGNPNFGLLKDLV